MITPFGNPQNLYLFSYYGSFYENVLFGNAAAIHPVYCSHSPVLLSVSKSNSFPCRKHRSR